MARTRRHLSGAHVKSAGIAVALVMASVRASAQAGKFERLAVPPVLSGNLGGPNVREALRGSISPDGRLLAYEVVVGHDRNIWLRDLATGQVRVLTTHGHENGGAVWSADGSKIAFVADSMVAVADVSTGAQRIVFDGALTKYHPPIVNLLRWYSDSELTVGYEALGFDRLRHSLWAVRIDSSDAHEIPRFWADSVEGITSPDGNWVARWIPMTAGRGGLRVESTQGHHSRCLAGLFTEDSRPLWSPDDDALLFIGHTGADTTPRVYQLPVRGGPARRVSGVTGSAFSVSINAHGDVAIITRANGTVVAGDLWLGHYPLAINERDTLAACHELPAEVVRWVRRQGLPSLRGVSELTAVPGQQLSLFHAVYGYGGDVLPNLLGLYYQGRIGWLIQPQPPRADSSGPRLQRFELRPGDQYLLSPQWDSALANVSPTATAWWLNILLWSPATPLSRLAQLVAQDPTLAAAVAQNPALGSTEASERELLELAAVSPVVAARVMENPRVAHDLRAWRWIEARFENRPEARDKIRDHLQTRERELLSDPLVPEPVLLEVLLNRVRVFVSNGDTLLFRLLSNPTAKRSRRILTILAIDRRDVPEALRQRALVALARMGVTRDQAVHVALHEQGADSIPCDEIRDLLSPSNLGDEVTVFQTEFVTMQSHRCAQLRREVGVYLAGNLYTPPASLHAIAVWLADSRDEPVATALIANRVVRGDSGTLRLLAGLPLPRVASQADSLLRVPRQWVRIREPVITWDTTAWARADSGTDVLLVPVVYTPFVLRLFGDLSSRDSVRLVIGDRDVWADWWNRVRPAYDSGRPDRTAAPGVDFSKWVIVAASNGDSAAGPELHGAWLRHDTLYVKLLSYGGIPSGCVATGKHNHITVARMPRPKTPVVFLEGRWTRSCSVW